MAVNVVTAVCLAASLAAQAIPAGVLPAPAGSAHRDFVAVSRTDPTIISDIRYATSHNFVGRRIDGYREPLCILTEQAATALGKAQRAVRKQGYSLKVYDCYRPQRAVNDFVKWAGDPGDQRMKREFYPKVNKEVLFEEGYIAEKSGHSRGSTLDLTLVKLPPKPQPAYRPGQPLVPCTASVRKRFPDNTIDMGTGYDCFDPLAHTLDPRITGVPLANRLLLKRAMTAAGFTNYELEWWHYTLAGEPFPDRYFDFPVAGSSL
ncbi:M15 family metallopeptidase [Actinoplanes sp. TFC3]|uniref:M15 family metallopeptidase n=1 Tax=Actinoplanes sp. TFC3 TaxID=1710355 RepID=UPI00082AE134|nr:M15 family metallopeptidase [Actinoplanes sp. TFC3]